MVRSCRKSTPRSASIRKHFQTWKMNRKPPTQICTISRKMNAYHWHWPWKWFSTCSCAWPIQACLAITHFRAWHVCFSAGESSLLRFENRECLQNRGNDASRCLQQLLFSFRHRRSQEMLTILEINQQKAAHNTVLQFGCTSQKCFGNRPKRKCEEGVGNHSKKWETTRNRSP